MSKITIRTVPDYKKGFTFITNEMFIEETYALLKKLPNIGGVLGCPRSGMIPASIIATSLSIPLYSLSDGVVVKLHSVSNHGGYRMGMFEEKNNLPILVIDDCCHTGAEMLLTKKLLKACSPRQHFIYSAVFSRSRSVPNHIDLYSKAYDLNHMFERDIYNNTSSKKIVFDMDGVLCEEKPYEIDKSSYEEHLKNLQPIKTNLPTLFGCKAVCTGRPKKYRRITQEWLSKNGVIYEKLIMFSGSYKEKAADYISVVGKYKAEECLKMRDVRLFIESSDEEAKVIAKALRASDNLTPVICSTTKKVY